MKVACLTKLVAVTELCPPREQGHHGIWKYCQSTSRVQAQVLQNLRGEGSTAA